MVIEEIKYDEILSWGALSEAIKQFQQYHKNEPLSNDQKLSDICREWFSKIGVSFDPINVDVVLKTVNKEVGIEAEESKVHQVEKEREFESVALDQSRLEILLDELDKSQNVEEITKNPLLEKVNKETIRDIINKKIRLQKEAESKGLSKTKADVVSDNTMVLEERLKNKGVEDKKAEEIAAKVAYIPAESNSIEEAGDKIAKAVSGETRSVFKETYEQTVIATAEVVVETEKERIAEEFVDDLKAEVNLDTDKAERVRKIIESKLVEQFERSLPKITENFITSTGLQSNLTEEIIEITGFDNKNSLDPKISELQAAADNFILVKPEEVGLLRRTILEEDVDKELILKGTETKTAMETARELGEFAYPKGMTGQMVKIDQEAVNATENSQQARNRAMFVKGLILSPSSPEKNVEFFKKLENIDGNQKIKDWQIAAKALNNRDLQSIKYIRDSVNFQKTIDRIVGGGAVRTGKVFHIERLQNWGNRIINRVDTIQWGEVTRNIATHFGNESFHTAFTNISNNFLGSGTVNPFGWIGKTGGLGRDILSKGSIALKKLGLNAGTALKGLATKFAPKLVASLGKLALGAAGPIGALLAVASFIDLKQVFKLVAYVVGGVFIGLLVIIPLLTLGPISSLVPTTGYAGPGTVGVGTTDAGGQLIIPLGGPGLGGGLVDGECSVADAVTAQTNYQCVASSTMNPSPFIDIKPGRTVCSEGCGPTSDSMILLRLNSKWTPEYLYQFEPSLISGGYGSSLNQNALAINRAMSVEKGVSDVAAMGGCRSAQDVANYICKGHKIVLVGANFIGHDGHLFLAVGVKNGIIQVKDPYPPYSDGNTNVFDGSGRVGTVAYDNNFGCVVIDADKLR